MSSLDAFEVASAHLHQATGRAKREDFYGEGLSTHAAGPVLLPLAGPQSHRHIELQRELKCGL